eukprot:2934967-Prymnesium_polylepis.1
MAQWVQQQQRWEFRVAARCNQAIKQSGNQAIRAEAGWRWEFRVAARCNQAIRQSSNQAIRQSEQKLD